MNNEGRFLECPWDDRSERVVVDLLVILVIVILFAAGSAIFLHVYVHLSGRPTQPSSTS